MGTISSRIIKKPWFWNRYWKAYARLADSLSYQELSSKSANNIALKDGGRYLDAACGMGLSTRALKIAAERQGMTIDVAANDINRRAVELAKGSLPGVSFVQADINQMPFADGVFDGILIINVLYLISDPLPVLRGFANMLKPGGTLVMANPSQKAKNGIVRQVVKNELKLYAESLKGSSSIGRAFKVFGRGFKLISDALRFLPYNLALQSGSPSFEDYQYWKSTAESVGFKFHNLEHAYGFDDILSFRIPAQ